MNKKRIRQMTASLLRRLTTQPNLRYLAPHREMVTEGGAVPPQSGAGGGVDCLYLRLRPDSHVPGAGF